MKGLTAQQGIEIQAEQLAAWKLVLKPEVYTELEQWATKYNSKIVASKEQLVKYVDGREKESDYNGCHITRGAELSNFVANFMYGHKPSTIYQQAQRFFN